MPAVESSTEFDAAKAGFGEVTTHQLAHDIQNNWYVVRKCVC